MARPFPWKCRNCGEQRVLPKVVTYQTEREHDGRLYSLVIPDLEILECEACKNRVLTDAAHKKVTAALREKAGLLTPEEIRQSRESLKLSQKQLAHYLRVAESTVCRWETGGQIQQRAMDTLLRAFFDVPEFQKYLGFLPKKPTVERAPVANLTMRIASPPPLGPSAYAVLPRQTQDQLA